MKPIPTGFLFGAALPEALGSGLLMHDIIDSAFRPLGPNQGRCGMPVFGAMLLILVVGPIGGMTGAAVASLVLALRARRETDSGIASSSDSGKTGGADPG